jgi:hypothetical protein
MKDGQRAYAELENRHEALEEQYAKLQTSHRQLMADYQGLERTFNNVIQSSSWRLTSPLRRALTLVRRKGPQ